MEMVSVLPDVAVEPHEDALQGPVQRRVMCASLDDISVPKKARARLTATGDPTFRSTVDGYPPGPRADEWGSPSVLENVTDTQ